MTAKDIRGVRLAEGQIALFYLGQVGFILAAGGKYIAIDPYLSDYVDKNCCQFVQWERQYAPPIAAEELDFLDAVICTHSHYDHADPWTLPKLAKASPGAEFIVPAPEAALIASYGIDRERIVSAYADVPLSVAGVTVTPIPSAHESFQLDEGGNHKCLGYLLEGEGWHLFHAGDMCMYEGLCERLVGKCDIAILPINGRDYFRNANDIIGNFDSTEAILLAKRVGADLLIPSHHDLYAVNKVNPAIFVDTLMALNPTQKYHFFVPGEKYIYAK